MDLSERGSAHASRMMLRASRRAGDAPLLPLLGATLYAVEGGQRRQGSRWALLGGALLTWTWCYVNKYRAADADGIVPS